jgi:hypothetical protein
MKTKNWQWFKQMIPYIIVAIWMVAITIGNFNTITAINKNESAQTKALCVSYIHTKELLSALLVNDITSTDNAQLEKLLKQAYENAEFKSHMYCGVPNQTLDIDTIK